MKKMMISLVLLFLIGISAYTIYDYNKSKESSISKTPPKGSTSLAENSDSTNNNLSSVEKNANNTSNTQSILKSFKIKAFDFKLKDLNGKDVSLSDYRGKKVFLNFWASWCPPCKAEMPEMEKLYQETKDSDLVILTVNLGEDKSIVQKFINDNRYDFPVLLDTDNVVASKYQVVSIPTSFFIDKEGNITYKHIGSMSIEDMKKYINNIK
jgi:thiol-disulfide isomerase/thioredoxin